MHCLDTCSILLYTPLSLYGIITPYSFSLWVIISSFHFPWLLLYFPFSLSGLSLLVSLPSQCLFFSPLPSPAPVISLFVCALPLALPPPSSLLVVGAFCFFVFSLWFLFLFICLFVLFVCLCVFVSCLSICFPLQGYSKEEIKAHLMEGPKYYYK